MYTTVVQVGAGIFTKTMTYKTLFFNHIKTIWFIFIF